jgi:hypothetical protein
MLNMDAHVVKAQSFRLKRSISKAGSTTRNVFLANNAKGLLTYLCWPLDLTMKFIARFAATRYHGLVITLVLQIPLLFLETTESLPVVQDVVERCLRLKR